MTDPSPVSLPAPQPGCRVTVCIPARNEAASIAQTLAALGAQRAIDGEPLRADFFDTIVFANNCTDDTAAIVRAAAAARPAARTFVLESNAGAGGAHIGAARKYVLDVAAARFLHAGRPAGIIASIDSDTLPAEDWVAWIAREMRGRDAVAGHVTIAERDQEQLLAPVRLLYARELTYRRVLADVEAAIDPLPEDPQPRHASFVGASFAVTAACYVAAGGLPPRRRLEDVAFAHALRRIDARIRHSLQVRATTSARLAARVDGGFGTFLAQLHDCARRGESFRVEHPRLSLANLESRAALRRIRAGQERCDDVERVATILNLPARTWLPAVDPRTPLGAIDEALARRARARRQSYHDVPVEEAIELLRGAFLAAKTRLHAAPFSDAELGSLDAS
jgi:hypothetical protein